MSGPERAECQYISVPSSNYSGKVVRLSGERYVDKLSHEVLLVLVDQVRGKRQTVRRTYSRAEREINLFRGSRVVDVDATEATEKPEHDQNDQDQAKNAAQAGPTVAIVAIVAAATAEENNQQDDDKDRAHHSTFLAKFNLPMCRCIRNVPLWFLFLLLRLGACL